MKVIVTGSLGHISQPLTKALIQKGHQVTVISSKQEKQNDIKALGANAAIGSVEDTGFLTATFSGADVVYAMVPANFTVPDQITHYRKIALNYAHAIRQSGVKRIVNLSGCGAELARGTGIILGFHEVENILNELSDVAVTYLRPGYFYYNLYNFVGMIKGQGCMGANYGEETKMVLVDPKDIAAAALEEIEAPISRNKVRYVASDERTAGEIAKILGAAIGKPDLRWITFTDEQVQANLERNGMPQNTAAKYVELWVSLRSGILLADYELAKPIAMGKVKLEDFAKEFAASF